MLPPDCASPCAKNVQGSRPAKEKIGYGSPSRSDLRQSAEKDREHQHRQEGLENRPGRPEQRLLVSDLDVPPDEKVEELAVDPEFSHFE